VRRLSGIAVAVMLVALAATAGNARAADECRGLLVCLPWAGPWVVVPARSSEDALPRADYDLRCPRRGYVVAGTDVRLSDRQLDVAIRGDTGSPVGPGVTTHESVVFTGTYVGAERRLTAFRPYIGCVPTTGGGGRARTARVAEPGLKPTRPLERRVVTTPLRRGPQSVVVRCGQSTRLVGGSHALGFRGDAPPSAAAVTAVSVVQQRLGEGILVRVRVGAAAVGANPEIQVHALCSRVAP
jgi:hypothetical protein